MPTFTGTPGDDDLVGTSGPDVLDGLGGNDRIAGGDGNDLLTGGPGDDVLLGEGGDDILIENDSGSGNDTLDGGAGNDFVSLYRLDQTLTETVNLRGGDGNDSITSWSYASGNVLIDAGAGDDYVELFSSTNSHQISLGAGRDILDLGHFQPIQGVGRTTQTVSDFQTGSGGDTVLLYDLLSGYGEWDGQSDPFQTGVIRLIQRGSDSILQMSGVGGAPAFNDLLIFQNTDANSFVADNFGGFSQTGTRSTPLHLTGDDSINTLNGGYGDDVIEAFGNTDSLDGLAGNDILRGGDGNDTIRGGYGNDVVEGGAGDDTIDMQHDGGSDSVDAGSGDDWIRVYRNFRDVVEHITVSAGDGNDELSFQNFDTGTLTADLGIGADRFILLGTRQNITLTLGAGADVIDLSQNYATLIGEMILGVADYVPGEDRIEWGAYLQNELIGWDGHANPFRLGFLRLEQGSGQLILSIDRDGLRSDFSSSPFIALDGVSVEAVSAADFAGFAPVTSRHAHSDFNGDGRSDILWRNDDGRMTDWLGLDNGGLLDNAANAYTSVDISWHVAGTGDFNGDGKVDVLWHRSDGAITDWLGTASGRLAPNGASLLEVVDPSWQIGGVGDFNGDGKDDVLWHRADGALTNWLGTASGGLAPNAANLLQVVDPQWQVAGVGDFNGDGKDDVLWHRADGALTDWLGTSTGGLAPNAGNMLAVVDPQWKVAGVGDFNGDGIDDVLWHRSDGALTNWLGSVNGGLTPNAGNFLTVVPNEWQVAAIGDYNGDAKDDILWRSTDGRTMDWLGTSSGAFVNNSVKSLTTVDAHWHIQPMAELL